MQHPRFSTLIRRTTYPTRRRGAACVEFAFAAPFIIMLIFGSIEFSRIVMVKQALTNAAREGSRKAALATSNNATDVDTLVRKCLKGTIAGYLDPNKVRVTLTPSTISGLPSGTIISTKISVDSKDVSWLPAMFVSNTAIESTATMKRE